MILVEELLQPITEGNPSGAWLRYDPLYDAIKEARREDANLGQGVWQRELKTADLARVIALSTEALQKRTKDLQIAAWLTEALMRQEGFAGLTAGLELLYGLVDKFWDSAYPPIEEDEYWHPNLEWRAAPLNWIGATLPAQVHLVPLNQAGHGWHQYSTRHIVDAPLAPEAFDQSFAGTPLEFYVDLEQQLDVSLTNLAALDGLCDEKFPYNCCPYLKGLQRSLETVAHVVQELLMKKRTELP